MTVPVEVLRLHVRYTRWASMRLVDAASKLPPADLTRDFRHADKSVLGTLVHTFAADRVWMTRIDSSPARFLDPATDMHLAVLQHDWPVLLDRLCAWVDALKEPLAEISYVDLRGTPHTTPLWQVVLHVVNHGTHHRGQVSAMLRAMGHVPPQLDLIAFYRELAAARAI